MSKQQLQRLSILINIFIPMIVLTKFSGEAQLGTTGWLIVALSFPLLYWIWELWKEGKRSFISWLGLFSVLMTWWIGLLKLPTQWIAIKEAMVPATIWLVLLWSMYTGHNLIEKLFLWILDTDKIFSKLENKMHHRHDWVKKLSRRIIGSFAFSTVLNYLLASWIVVSPSGTQAFNEEIWRLTGLSFPAIALPSTLILTAALMFFLSKMSTETWLEIEDMIKKE